MTIRLSVSQRLRMSHPADFSLSASGLESNLGATWFHIGAKRTTGAPTTVGDLTEKFTFMVIDGQRGSYVWGDTATAKVVLTALSPPISLPAALAGDHMYLLVTSGLPPESGTTFDATKSLGTLGA